MASLITFIYFHFPSLFQRMVEVWKHLKFLRLSWSGYQSQLVALAPCTHPFSYRGQPLQSPRITQNRKTVNIQKSKLEKKIKLSPLIYNFFCEIQFHRTFLHPALSTWLHLFLLEKMWILECGYTNNPNNVVIRVWKGKLLKISTNALVFINYLKVNIFIESKRKLLSKGISSSCAINASTEKRQSTKPMTSSIWLEK